MRTRAPVTGSAGACLGTGRVVHGPGTDEILVNVSAASGARTYYHADERGSIVATSDDAGTTVATRSYDEYGRPSGAGLGFGFTGQMFLTEAGPTTAYYYRARVYHSGLGRFLQADPIGYGDGMNMYAYVGGDPVNRSDPSGMRSDDIYVNGRRADGAGTGLGTFGGIGNGAAPSSNQGETTGTDIVVNGQRIRRPVATLPQAAFTLAGGLCATALAPADPFSLLPPTFVAFTPFGDTKGEHPRITGSTINTDLPGGFVSAEAIFIGLLRLAGDTEIDLPKLSTSIAVGRPSGIRLRVGLDPNQNWLFAPRIDIPANTFQLTRPETIHFTGGRGIQCPRQ